MMKPSQFHGSFSVLIEVMKHIQFRLERDPQSSVMVAMPTFAEFKKQQLPVGCSVSKRTMPGPRVPTQGRLSAGAMRTLLARWPRAGLVEAALPSLFFVVNGKADLRVANYVVHCPAGAILFVPGGIPKMDGSRPHYEEIVPHAHCDLLMLSPGQVSVEGLECSLCHSQGERHEYGGKDEACWVKHRLIAQLFSGFADEVQNEGNVKSTRQLLDCMLFLLAREIERGGAYRSFRHHSEPADQNRHDPIHQAIAYMTDHLDTPLSIDRVSRQVGFSRRAFTARFREKTGETFNAYLTDLRVERARVLLRETNLEINQVSSLVGLGSDQLRQLFHRLHDCTPGEYRSQIRLPEKRAGYP